MTLIYYPYIPDSSGTDRNVEGWDSANANNYVTSLAKTPDPKAIGIFVEAGYDATDYFKTDQDLVYYTQQTTGAVYSYRKIEDHRNQWKRDLTSAENWVVDGSYNAYYFVRFSSASVSTESSEICVATINPATGADLVTKTVQAVINSLPAPPYVHNRSEGIFWIDRAYSALGAIYFPLKYRHTGSGGQNIDQMFLMKLASDGSLTSSLLAEDGDVGSPAAPYSSGESYFLTGPGTAVTPYCMPLTGEVFVVQEGFGSTGIVHTFTATNNGTLVSENGYWVGNVCNNNAYDTVYTSNPLCATENGYFFAYENPLNVDVGSAHELDLFLLDSSCNEVSAPVLGTDQWSTSYVACRGNVVLLITSAGSFRYYELDDAVGTPLYINSVGLSTGGAVVPHKNTTWFGVATNYNDLVEPRRFSIFFTDVAMKSFEASDGGCVWMLHSHEYFEGSDVVYFAPHWFTADVA